VLIFRPRISAIKLRQAQVARDQRFASDRVPFDPALLFLPWRRRRTIEDSQQRDGARRPSSRLRPEIWLAYNLSIALPRAVRLAYSIHAQYLSWIAVADAFLPRTCIVAGFTRVICAATNARTVKLRLWRAGMLTFPPQRSFELPFATRETTALRNSEHSRHGEMASAVGAETLDKLNVSYRTDISIRPLLSNGLRPLNQRSKRLRLRPLVEDTNTARTAMGSSNCKSAGSLSGSALFHYHVARVRRHLCRHISEFGLRIARNQGIRFRPNFQTTGRSTPV
jgi:hypothetical protein